MCSGKKLNCIIVYSTHRPSKNVDFLKYTLHMRRDDSMQDKPWGQVVKYPPYMGDDSDALRKTIEAQEYPPYVEG